MEVSKAADREVGFSQVVIKADAPEAAEAVVQAAGEAAAVPVAVAAQASSEARRSADLII